MNATIGVSTLIPMLFLDALGAGKTGLTVTASARKAGTTTTVSGAVTERTGGEYDATLTLTSTGVWLFKGATTIDGDPALWTETIDVLPAAADPAAIADAISAVQADVTTVKAMTDVATSTRATPEDITDPLAASATGHEAGTIGYEIHALFKRPTGGRG